ncbi:MAG TPA: S24/S26 family peptidase [Mobilitalea sp.]|nr:S24/S26 family peptidase [Mobilitalea sp.]
MKKEDIIRKQLSLGILRINLIGNSMLPTFQPGDSVYVTAIRDEVKVNDIVLFYDKEVMILHRVLQVVGDYVITQGDHNTYLDRPVKIKKLLGIVCEQNGETRVIQKVCEQEKK